MLVVFGIRQSCVHKNFQGRGGIFRTSGGFVFITQHKKEPKSFPPDTSSVPKMLFRPEFGEFRALPQNPQQDSEGRLAAKRGEGEQEGRRREGIVGKLEGGS